MKAKPFLRSRVTWLLVIALLAFTGGCAYLETKQGSLIFSPVQGEWRGYRGAPEGVEEVWIPVGSKGERLHAWWMPLADKSAPTLLYLHGARWNLTGSVTRIPRWNRMGFSVLAIDYRGFGKSTFADGGAPTEQSANEDAEAAWNYLGTREPAGNAKRFIFGHSLGASMATHLAITAKDASGLILEGAFTSIPDMIRETKWGFLPVGFLVTQRFDNLDRIGEVKVPILIAHGTEDSIVPVTMSDRLYASAKAPKRLLRIDGGSHHNLTANFFDEYSRAVAVHFGLGGEQRARSASPAIGVSIGASINAGSSAP